MKTSLDHLPHNKQRQLADVTATLCAMAPVEMVILFGSHARGDWVDDPVGGYFSDYDILVIVKNRKLAEKHTIWNPIWDRLRPRLGETALSLIVHDIKDVNQQLEKGFYFFTDVKKEGVVLYDSQRFALAQEKERSPEERLEQARVWFTDWFGEANEFLETFEDACAKGKWKMAAFLLHQATERYYHTILLVFTAYSKVETEHQISLRLALERPIIRPPRRGWTKHPPGARPERSSGCGRAWGGKAPHHENARREGRVEGVPPARRPRSAPPSGPAAAATSHRPARSGGGSPPAPRGGHRITQPSRKR